MKLLFKPMLAAVLIFFTTSANALLIEISENSDFSSAGTGSILIDDAGPDLINGFAFSLGVDGSVAMLGALGDWSWNVITGTSSPLIGDEYVDKLDLLSLNTSGGSGTLYIRLTDTDFDKLLASYTTWFGGATEGTVSFQSYADASNEAFGKGILLADSGDISAGAFSGADSGGLVMSDPYSLSIYAAITHTGAGDASSFNYFVKVPEPGTLALFGIGLLGMGLATRKRQV